MKKYLIFSISILIMLYSALLLISCQESPVETDETTVTIAIPDVNGITFTFTNVYPMYFKPMSGDSESGIPYWFYFKEGGTVTCDKNFSVSASGYYEDGVFTEKEQLLFDAGEAFILNGGDEYFSYGYSDGHISSEYDYENRPLASLGFFVVSEEEYEIMLEEQYTYGENYPVDSLIAEN